MLLKRTLLGLWALWLSLVTASNLFDGLVAIGAWPAGWPFVSGNLQLMVEVTSVYSSVPWLTGLLFAGVVLWEGAAAYLLWKAAVTFRPGNLRPVYAAFTVNFALWGGFLVAEEVFLAYHLEGVHMGILTAQVATLLAVALLPDDIK